MAVTSFVHQIENIPERIDICGRGYDERGNSYSTKRSVEVGGYLNSTSEVTVLKETKTKKNVVCSVLECFIQPALNWSPRR
jgi:hypothetical protein